MRRTLKTMLAVSACMLVMPLSAYAAQPVNGQVLDSSVVVNDDSTEVTELFKWNFDDPTSEVAPLGDYYAMGSAGISKKSSTSAYITASTDCHVKCDSVVAEVNLQRLEGSTWQYVTAKSKTAQNKSTVKVSDTINVKKGYYYRVVSFHSATKNGKTERGNAISESLYIG